MSKESSKGKRYSPLLDKMFNQKKTVGRVVSWEGVPADVMYRLVVAVNDALGSVMFGATRDRGAWSVTIWHTQLGNKPQTDYCNSEDMLIDWVTGLAEFWEDVASEIRAQEDDTGD